MLKTCSSHEFLWCKEGEEVDLSLDWRTSLKMLLEHLGIKVWMNERERERVRSVLVRLKVNGQPYPVGGKGVYIGGGEN